MIDSFHASLRHSRISAEFRQGFLKMKLYLHLFFIILVLSLAVAKPFFFFGGWRPRSWRRSYYSGGGGGYRGRSYSDIARVINPNPYTNPSGPFWTYG